MKEADWEATTWEGNRRDQQEAFMRLSFREKIQELERMSEVAMALQRPDEAQSRGRQQKR